jgi:acyl-CoA dehydrogenase
LREVKGDVDDRQAEVIGKISAHIIAMRRMSISVALMLEEGKNPALEASVVKDLGNSFEKTMPELLRLIAPENTSERFQQTLKSAILHAPSFTLRGGTREILRGVIARGLGLR